MKKIIISGIGSAGAQNIVKSLRKIKEQVYIIGLDCDEHNPGKFIVDKFFLIPKANQDNYLNQLKDIIDEIKPDLFIPVAPQELLKVSKNKKTLNTKVLISDSATIKIFNSKKSTTEFFEKNHIPTLKILHNEFTFPAFGREDISSGGIGSRKLCNFEELNQYLETTKQPIITEFVDGEEYSVDCFCDKDSELIGWVSRVRLQTKGGVATKSLTKKIPNLQKEIEKITKNCHLIGPFNVQLFLRNGKKLFFELNPRIGGSFIHSVEAGLDIGNYIIDFIENRNSKKLDSWKENLYMLRYWNEYFE